jgi:hypothetical protein
LNPFETLASIRTSPKTIAKAKKLLQQLPTLAESFPQQWAYETSDAPLNAVACSRRAGKSRGAVRRHTRTLLTARPGSWTHAGSLIRRNARKHFWDPVKFELDRLGWKYHIPNNAEMILETERGTWFQAFGCDDEAGTKAVQGDGSVLFTIDECHLPHDNVLKLLVDVAEPMLTDSGGALDLLGLPPETDGFFQRALDGLDEEGQPIEGTGWRVFGWNMFAHDFPRSREAKLKDVIDRVRRRGLKLEYKVVAGDDGRPIITCEEGTSPLVAWQYFGLRVRDPEKRAYEFQRGLNEYDPRVTDLSWLTA